MICSWLGDVWRRQAVLTRCEMVVRSSNQRPDDLLAVRPFSLRSGWTGRFNASVCHVSSSVTFYDPFWRLDLGLFEEITNDFLQWRRLRRTCGSSDHHHTEPANILHLA